jgi:pimeloyl-ACP methyl ester carboxylesterase
VRGGEARGTLVVFHGNAGHAGHRGFYGELVDGLGLRLILAEYPGYGPRAGELGEASLVADAAATVELARRDFGASGPLILFGESLGAGVAAAACARVGHAGIAGLVLATPWDRLENVAAHHYPWLPRPLLSLFLRDRYDSVAHLAGWSGPSAVIVVERDRIVPAESGRALFAALAGDKRLRVVAGADHNDWMARVGPDWWRETLAPMLSRSGPTTDPVD